MDTINKKVNAQSKELKEIRNLHAIIVERLATHQTNARAMESVKTTTNMVTKPMNARRHQNLKVNVTSAKGMVTRYQNIDPNHLIQLRNL